VSVIQGEFRFRHPVEVRFRDIDVGGHAHHSEAFMYFEEARAAYWRDIAGQGGLEGVTYIMAEATVRWHKRVLWPQTLSVGVRVSRLGRKHWEMEYEVLGQEGDRLITGRSTQVMYDYEAQGSKVIPDEIRAAMAACDGPFGVGGHPATADQGGAG
jgi:acyl-CoA thioester hydrolase